MTNEIQKKLKSAALRKVCFYLTTKPPHPKVKDLFTMNLIKKRSENNLSRHAIVLKNSSSCVAAWSHSQSQIKYLCRSLACGGGGMWVCGAKGGEAAKYDWGCPSVRWVQAQRYQQTKAHKEMWRTHFSFLLPWAGPTTSISPVKVIDDALLIPLMSEWLVQACSKGLLKYLSNYSSKWALSWPSARANMNLN